MREMSKHGWSRTSADSDCKACYCIGPQDGALLCPCRLRDSYKRESLTEIQDRLQGKHIPATSTNTKETSGK